MEFFETVKRRRSCRNYSPTPVPAEVINRAIDAALIAPNSSNMQTWRIYWVKSEDRRKKVIEACLNQSAARTAKELVVFTCDARNWKVSAPILFNAVKDGTRQDLKDYYSKLMPLIYGYRWLAPVKWLGLNLVGLFRPMIREVATSRDLQEVSVKSTALACENFMLAIAAQGFDTCPMEGFDSTRIRRALNLTRTETIVMVISVGERTDRGIWGEQFRIPREIVVKEI